MQYFTPLILCLMFAMVSVANATEYPISEKLIREHFYHDELHGELKTALEAENRRFKQLDERVMRFKGAKAVIPFSHAKWKVHYTPEQVKTAKEQGWVETWHFAWSISEKSILTTLPPWLDKLVAEVAQLEADFAVNAAPEAMMETVNKTRQRISDFIGNQRSILLRLKQWDGWCRKGPWLLESSNPRALAKEISALELYLRKRKADEKADFPFHYFTTVSQKSADDELVDFAAINLKEKKIIWNWYHAFKAKSKGKFLMLDENGYRFELKYQIYGPGARMELMQKIRRAMQHYWQGAVGGMPFTTHVEISIRSMEEEEQSDAMQVRIGAEDENIWPTYLALPYHVDAETIAHEFGHGLGFTDRYRDVYSFSERIYRSYQWDLFALMSAQNGPDPVVTEDDLMQLIKHYLIRPNLEPDRKR